MEQRRAETMHENQDELCVCPTFNSYSSDRMAEIAERVADEFSEEKAGDLREVIDDDGIEFSFVRDDSEVFSDGQIGPIFPIFNRDLLFADSDVSDDRVDWQSNKQSSENEIRIQLKNLFLREQEERDSPSSSSSEADELESVPPGTYCLWKPKVPESSPSRCKKSNSTGSLSKRWKLLDLLRRSNSDGKDSYVFLTPKDREEKQDKNEQSKFVRKHSSSKSKAKGLPPSPSLSAHEAFYVRNRIIKDNKKKSYLPYRQDLVGFFGNVNGFRGAFRPF